jgi:hypothetical protein
MGGNAVDDGGVIVADHASDLAEAVLALGVVTDQPPELVASSRDSTSATTTADLGTDNTATLTDCISERE